MGGFIESKGPALKADLFVMTGHAIGKENLHPSLANIPDPSVVFPLKLVC